MRKENTNAPIVGGSSLITVFAVLCLIVFTMLTLSTVVASKGLAQASYDAVEAFYTADAEAEKVFALLKNGDIPPSVTINGNIYSYECRISETQILEVEISCINGNWNVIKWCSVNSKQ